MQHIIENSGNFSGQHISVKHMCSPYANQGTQWYCFLKPLNQ